MAGEDLTSIHGAASRPGRAPVHSRPQGTTDATVAALGKLSEALETVEHARGLLYGFHRLSGSADLALQEAVQQLGAAGHTELAEDIGNVLIGRDVVDGRWTFELVEAYDRDYWSVFRDVERHARAVIGDAEPHVLESDMKRDEQQR
jgi:hypothetical protein